MAIPSEALSILLGTFFAGSMFNVPVVVIPTLIHTSTNAQTLIAAWRALYDYSDRVMPPLCLSTSALYGYTSWSKSCAGQPWHNFAAAGALTFAVVPFTFTVMAPSHRRLFVEKTSTREDAVKRVQAWNRLHIVRTLLPSVGAVVGMLGLLGREVL